MCYISTLTKFLRRAGCYSHAVKETADRHVYNLPEGIWMVGSEDWNSEPPSLTVVFYCPFRISWLTLLRCLEDFT